MESLLMTQTACSLPQHHAIYRRTVITISSLKPPPQSSLEESIKPTKQLAAVNKDNFLKCSEQSLHTCAVLKLNLSKVLKVPISLQAKLETAWLNYWMHDREVPHINHFRALRVPATYVLAVKNALIVSFQIFWIPRPFFPLAKVEKNVTELKPETTTVED